MKRILYLGFLMVLASCVQNEESVVEEQENKMLVEFLSNSKSLENYEHSSVIKELKSAAELEADEKVELTKNNMEIFLKSTANYKNAIIIVEEHTVVSFSDVSNCKMSGSWSSCMPFATGFIRKGELIFQEDYINNIIGLPDNQKRVGYLFN